MVRSYEIHKCMWFGFDLIVNNKIIAWGKTKDDITDLIKGGVLDV